eukprot:887811-Prymnesium_polylepis.1
MCGRVLVACLWRACGVLGSVPAARVWAAEASGRANRESDGWRVRNAHSNTCIDNQLMSDCEMSTRQPW